MGENFTDLQTINTIAAERYTLEFEEAIRKAETVEVNRKLECEIHLHKCHLSWME